jgi:hypothetical protein
VKKNCPPAITRKTVEAAVKSACDKEDRSRNVIIYGVEETSGEVLPDEIGKILEEIDEKAVVGDCQNWGEKVRRYTSPPRQVLLE